MNLEEVRLFQNELIGSIPEEFGNLNDLIHLNLRNNNLNGFIPHTFGNLNSLEILYLHNNNLNGSIPLEIFGLTNLKRLFLNNNQLNGALTQNIANLESIERFRIEKKQHIWNHPRRNMQLNLQFENSFFLMFLKICFVNLIHIALKVSKECKIHLTVRIWKILSIKQLILFQI